VKRNLNSTI